MNIHAQKLAQLRWNGEEKKVIRKAVKKSIQPRIKVNVNGRFSHFISFAKKNKAEIQDGVFACVTLTGYVAVIIFTCSAIQFIIS